MCMEKSLKEWVEAMPRVGPDASSPKELCTRRSKFIERRLRRVVIMINGLVSYVIRK